MTDFEAWAFVLMVYGSLGMVIIGMVGKCYEIIRGRANLEQPSVFKTVMRRRNY